jgi:hypothetical protein
MGTATLGVSAALFAFDKWRNAASKEQENKEQDVPVQEATTDARNAPEEQEIPVYTAEQEEQIEIKNK